MGSDRIRFLEDVAREAGEVIIRHYGRLTEVGRKGVRDLVTVADREAEALVIERIRAAFPGESILAEETLSEQAMTDRLWILDPLDGTTNFVHRIPHVAVSLAYWENRKPSAACVFNPIMGECFTAVAGNGAYLGKTRLRVSTTHELKEALLATGFHYRMEQKDDDNLQHFVNLARQVRGLRRLGSAALDLCYVADGRYDGFWELHLSPWDVAAGGLIVMEAGGYVTDFKGGDDWLMGGTIVAANPSLYGPFSAEINRPLL